MPGPKRNCDLHEYLPIYHWTLYRRWHQLDDEWDDSPRQIPKCWEGQRDAPSTWQAKYRCNWWYWGNQTRKQALSTKISNFKVAKTNQKLLWWDHSAHTLKLFHIPKKRDLKNIQCQFLKVMWSHKSFCLVTFDKERFSLSNI